VISITRAVTFWRFDHRSMQEYIAEICPNIFAESSGFSLIDFVVVPAVQSILQAW